MDKQYKWQISFDAAGPLDAGILEGDSSEHTTSALSGSASAKYYFIDSNNIGSMPANWWQSNYSRVVLDVATSWVAQIDDRNNLNITATTVITSIKRDKVVGSPTQYDHSGRNMNAYHYKGGTSLWYYHDTNIATTKTIATNVDLGSWTFSLAPGTGANQHTMYFFNKNDTYNTSGDKLNLGVKFTNILPPDYRPGKIWNGSKWMSHDRAGGAANIRGTSAYIEMRTINGGTGTGNPPYIRNNSTYHNMRLIGSNS